MKVGDYVTRKKYGNDILFKVDKIVGNTIYLKGVDVRLYADCDKSDLILSTISKKKEEIVKIRSLDKDKYFFIIGSILHLDSDSEYMEKCLDYYKKQGIKCNGYVFNESKFKENLKNILLKHKPSILVITGHDAHYNKRKANKEYKNSEYFIESVIEARKIYNSHENLVIISGACQSDYESLILAGSTFASSPKRINIHCLDPAIVATSIALEEKTNKINIEEILGKTHYKSDGMGGIIINGTMQKGYPRGKIIKENK